MTVPLEQRLLLTQADVAALCGVDRNLVGKWASDPTFPLRLLPHLKQPRIPKRELLDWLARQPGVAA